MGGNPGSRRDQAPVKMAWKDIVFAPSDPPIAYAGTAGWYSCGSFDVQQPGGGSVPLGGRRESLAGCQ